MWGLERDKTIVVKVTEWAERKDFYYDLRMICLLFDAIKVNSK